MSKSYSALATRPELIAFLAQNNFTEARPAQARSFEPLMEGKSMALLAPTGSGKTLAYLLPLMARLKEQEEQGHKIEDMSAPRALILAPTRELATQILKVIKSVTHHLKLSARSFDAPLLKKSKVDIMVAVPGGLSKALSGRNPLPLKHCGVLVLDEADQLMDTGFKRELSKILEHLPKNPQVILVSATMSPEAHSIRDQIFKGVDFEQLPSDGVNAPVSAFVETFNIYLQEVERPVMAREFVARKKDANGIIFVNKKEQVLKLLDQLKEAFPRLNFQALHGGLPAIERRRAFKKYRDEGGILVCTDIVSRGIDWPNIDWVLNYDLPFEAVYYIHRAGRVGRANGTPSGAIYNLVAPRDRELIVRINEAIKGQTALKLSPIQNRFKNTTTAASKGTTRKKVRATPGNIRRK